MWSRNVPMDISGTNKQRRSGRRRYYGRRRRRNPGRQALKEVRQVKKVLERQTNLKSRTTLINGLPIASGTNQITSLVCMPRGDTNMLREGDKITLKNVTWRFSMQLDTAEANPTVVRFILVYDRRPNGTQAAIDDVLNGTNVYGLMNLSEDQRGRFQILHDQFWTMATGGTEVVYEKGFKDMKNKRVLYDATAGDITDVQQGNFFALFTAQMNSANVICNGWIRIRFVDDS